MINILFSKSIRFFVIPIMLFLFWLSAPIFFQSAFSFTTLSFIDSPVIFPQVIHKDQAIKGEFIAKEDNLGAIEFMLWNTNTYQGFLTMKLQEKGAKNFIADVPVKTLAIGQNILYPYGFPVQPNSKEKTYVFTLTETSSNKDGILKISEASPVFISVYKFNKSELVRNPKLLVRFVYEKIIATYQYPGFFMYSLRFLLPLVFYFLWIWLRRSNLFTQHKLLGGVFLVSILYIVLLQPIDSYIITIFACGIWLYLAKKYSFVPIQLLSWGCIYLMLAILFLIFSQLQMAVNAGDIFYALLLCVIIQMVKETNILHHILGK